MTFSAGGPPRWVRTGKLDSLLVIADRPCRSQVEGRNQVVGGRSAVHSGAHVFLRLISRAGVSK